MLCGLGQVNKNIPCLGWLKMLQIKFSQIALFVANVEFTHWKLSDITVKIWIVAMYVIFNTFPSTSMTLFAYQFPHPCL